MKAEDPDMTLHLCSGLLGVREREQSLADVNYLVKLYRNDTFHLLLTTAYSYDCFLIGWLKGREA